MAMMFVAPALAGSTESTNATVGTTNTAPVISSITASPNPVKGGNPVTITAINVTDADHDNVTLYCHNVNDYVCKCYLAIRYDII